MLGTKRFIRHGLFISALGHAGLLAVGLLLVSASPHDAVPPDATLVELVTPREIPRPSGTPSLRPTSGTEQAAKPQPAIAPSLEQQQQKPQKEQKGERKAERNAAAKAKDAPQENAAQPQQPPMIKAEAAEVAMVPPPPDAPSPPAAAAPDAAEAAASMQELAQLALLGGPLGGGFAAPPVDSPVVGYDFTLPFRELVSSCAPPTPGVDRTDKVTIRIRIFLNRDGTLTKAPELLEPNPSAKQQAMMASFATGLEKCQPYTMLPPQRYKQWKVINLLVYPIDAFGG
jgi:hypothetical protein